MRTIEELQDEYNNACIEEDRARRNGYVPESIMLRRDAATRLLHAAEDPWNDCLCHCCVDIDS